MFIGNECLKLQPDLSKSTVFPDCCYVGDYVIPDSVTSIGSNAFCRCTGLKNVIIPDGVTSIGGYAFYECISLTGVIISEGVTSIGSMAFYGCTGLTTINYTGTEEQWNAISKGSDWNKNVPSDCQIVFNYAR